MSLASNTKNPPNTSLVSAKGPSVTITLPFFHRSVLDRKSTRLNSSHLGISYAVFCLKKKIKIKQTRKQIDLNMHTYLPNVTRTIVSNIENRTSKRSQLITTDRSKLTTNAT